MVEGEGSTTSTASNDSSQPIRPRAVSTGLPPPSVQTSPRESEMEFELKYGAQHVIKLFIPVSLCILVVVSAIAAMPNYTKTRQYLVYTPFRDQNVSTITRLWQSFANALILLVTIIILTIVLIILYTKRFYKLIQGWLITSSLMLLFIFMFLFINEIIMVYNIPFDIFTALFITWNLGVVGLICIHWKGPLILQQAYLIMISALMALILIRHIPEWTIWVVLGVISIWDLVAVLCPVGPLRILVETAQERDEPIFPGLIYSSAVAWIYTPTIVVGTTTTTNTTSNNTTPSNGGDVDNQSQNEPQYTANQPDDTPEVEFQQPASNLPPVRPNRNSSSSEERGIKLGLGDFIFYSVLVGKASSYHDWNTTIACFVSILVGLSLTLSLLAFYQKALPALPISITFGLISYFSTSIFIRPFCDALALKQVFI